MGLCLRTLGIVMKHLERVLVFVFILLLIFIPLGIWKLIDIIIWLCHNLHVDVVNH
jgi:hypothetical protein